MQTMLSFLWESKLRLKLRSLWRKKRRRSLQPPWFVRLASVLRCKLKIQAWNHNWTCVLNPQTKNESTAASYAPVFGFFCNIFFVLITCALSFCLALPTLLSFLVKKHTIQWRQWTITTVVQADVTLHLLSTNFNHAGYNNEAETYVRKSADQDKAVQHFLSSLFAFTTGPWEWPQGEFLYTLCLKGNRIQYRMSSDRLCEAGQWVKHADFIFKS